MLPQSPVAAQVLSLTNSIGIYIHIPFCRSKCNYCAFYSVCADKSTTAAYCKSLIEQITKRGSNLFRPVSSVYFGGGTPSVLSAEQLTSILSAVKQSFSVLEDAEITIEVNPADDLEVLLPTLYKNGFNRLSLGIQSGNDNELQLLGRRHNKDRAKEAVKIARKSGFKNISVDLMLGLPESTTESLKNSLNFILSLNAEHISAYILKLEKGTPMYQMSNSLKMPDDDMVAEQYLFMSDYLKQNGFYHYEISNFAKKGYESRHNSAYWECGEYLGFGPAAHSFYEGNRYYFGDSIEDFINNPHPIPDGKGGNEEEYIMLGLRLSKGISNTEFKQKFGKELTQGIFNKAQKLAENGLLETDGDKISLTAHGMLVSNKIITELLEELN